MILKKKSNSSARWDHSTNSWLVGTTDEYQWTNERTKEYSLWMNLDDALIWIKEKDESQKTN